MKIKNTKVVHIARIGRIGIFVFGIMIFNISSAQTEKLGSTAKDSIWILDTIDQLSVPNILRTKLTLEFLAEGDTTLILSGYDGCNTFSSRVKVQDSNLYLQRIRMTKKSCSEYQDFSKSYVQTWKKAHHYKMTVQRLTIYAEGNIRLIQYRLQNK